jgi:hypothetical protein
MANIWDLILLGSGVPVMPPGYAPDAAGNPLAKNAAQLPKDPNAPESPSAVEDPSGKIVSDNRPKQQEQLKDQPLDKEDRLPALGEALASRQQMMPQQAPVPRKLVTDNQALQTLMLQMGLNMMVPQWGGPLEQIAMGFGSGAEAVGRRQAGLDEQTALEAEQRNADLKNQSLQALTSQRTEAAETSRSKRLKGTAGKQPSTEFERLAAKLQLGPKGQALFKAGLKNLNDPLDERDEATQLEELLAQAQAADAEPGATPGAAPTAGGPKAAPPVGTIMNGHRFKGGDPSKQANWEKV